MNQASGLREDDTPCRRAIFDLNDPYKNRIRPYNYGAFVCNDFAVGFPRRFKVRLRDHDDLVKRPSLLDFRTDDLRRPRSLIHTHLDGVVHALPCTSGAQGQAPSFKLRHYPQSGRSVRPAATVGGRARTGEGPREYVVAACAPIHVVLIVGKEEGVQRWLKSRALPDDPTAAAASTPHRARGRRKKSQAADGWAPTSRPFTSDVAGSIVPSASAIRGPRQL